MKLRIFSKFLSLAYKLIVVKQEFTGKV